MNELYERDGYVTFEDRFPEDRRVRLREAALRLVARIPEWGVENPRLQWNSSRTAVRTIAFPTDLEPAFEELITDEWLLSRIRPVLGQDIEYFEGGLVLKGPGERTAFPWHQDLAHVPHTNSALLTAAIHLDDFTDGKGAVSIVPGSHLRGLAHHRQCLLSLTEEERDAGILQRVPAGTLTLWHSLVWHEGTINRAPNLRMRALFFFRAADCAPLGSSAEKPPGMGRHNGMLVSGERRPPRLEPLRYQENIRAP